MGETINKSMNNIYPIVSNSLKRKSKKDKGIECDKQVQTDLDRVFRECLPKQRPNLKPKFSEVHGREKGICGVGETPTFRKKFRFHCVLKEKETNCTNEDKKVAPTNFAN